MRNEKCKIYEHDTNTGRKALARCAQKLALLLKAPRLPTLFSYPFSLSPMTTEPPQALSLEERFERASALGAQRWEATLQNAPAEAECRTHGPLMAVLNIAASNVTKKLVYTCRQCVEAERARSWVARMANAGIPGGLQRATLKNFMVDRQRVNAELHSPAEFLAATRRFLARDVRNLGLSGDVGIGKSHLMAAVLKDRLWHHGLEVLWRSSPAMFAELAALRETKPRYTRGQLLAKYVRPSILGIDELAIRPMTPHEQEWLFEVIEARDQAGRQTAFTTNLPGISLPAIVGDRVVDRLQQGGLEYCFGAWESGRGLGDLEAGSGGGLEARG